MVITEKNNSLNAFKDLSSSSNIKNFIKKNNLKIALPALQLNKNSNIKTKFSKLMSQIHIKEAENGDKKMLILKEINDMEDVFKNELDLIKMRQYNKVESIRDFKLDNNVETKVKLLKSYFSNKKKGKYIIKL